MNSLPREPDIRSSITQHGVEGVILSTFLWREPQQVLFTKMPFSGDCWVKVSLSLRSPFPFLFLAPPLLHSFHPHNHVHSLTSFTHLSTPIHPSAHIHSTSTCVKSPCLHFNNTADTHSTSKNRKGLGRTQYSAHILHNVADR